MEADYYYLSRTLGQIHIGAKGEGGRYLNEMPL
jgi:hypothetical protein